MVTYFTANRARFLSFPRKAGIQDLWLPETPAAPELDARLRGHDTWELVLADNQNTSP